MQTYLDANQDSGKKFYMELLVKGKIVKLNLLKFKSIADYSNQNELRPEKKITEKTGTLFFWQNMNR